MDFVQKLDNKLQSFLDRLIFPNAVCFPDLCTTKSTFKETQENSGVVTRRLTKEIGFHVILEMNVCYDKKQEKAFISVKVKNSNPSERPFYLSHNPIEVSFSNFEELEEILLKEFNDENENRHSNFPTIKADFEFYLGSTPNYEDIPHLKKEFSYGDNNDSVFTAYLTSPETKDIRFVFYELTRDGVVISKGKTPLYNDSKGYYVSISKIYTPLYLKEFTKVVPLTA